MAWGGPYHWGPKLGVEIPPRTVIWNEITVRAALTPFLEDRERWPSPREFKEAGLMSLYWATDQHGGKTHWAEEFGLKHRSRARAWSKERIEQELVDFLGDRKTLPTRDEFAVAGRRDLCGAMRSHGGVLY